MINILYAGARKFVNNHRIKYLVPILHRQFKGCPVYLRKWYSSSAQTIAPSNTTAGGNATAKDLLVFRYENPRFFKYLNFFAIVQFMFWNYLSYFSFTSLKDTPVPQADDSLPWWRRINLGDNKYRNGITIMCFLIGYGVLAIGWMYTLRSVRYLVLSKSGDAISLITYTPFGQNRILSNVPLKCISAQESREVARAHLALKVKNHSFFYILDMRGQFLNTRIFDYTVGLQRKL